MYTQSETLKIVEFTVLAPLELLTLFFDLPFMLLLSDIREGIFYAALLSFWLVFAGEHLMVSSLVSMLKFLNYWNLLILLHLFDHLKVSEIKQII